ncbi:MAG: PH domain-containing protein [Mycobacterium sp.]|nr:PH domain-containing protein [Mycobacterium sp.]
MTEETGGWDLEVRPRRVKYVAYAAALVIVVVHVTVGALLKLSATGVIFQTSDQVAMGVLGVLLAGAVLLFTRPRLRVGPDGLAVRNVLSDKVIAWSEIVGVSFPVGARWARVDLPDDEYVPMMAIQSVDKGLAVDAMDRVRELVAQYRPDLSAPSTTS